MVIALFAVYTFVALFSYINTGAEDQSLLEHTRPGEWLNQGKVFKNYCGSMGAEVKYRWRHKTRGLYTAYSTGMLAGKEDGCVTIYGFFKGVPADRTQLYGYDPDLQLLTRLLAEKMLDSFAFCALVAPTIRSWSRRVRRRWPWRARSARTTV